VVAAMAFVTLAYSRVTLRVNAPRRDVPADPAAEAFATIATTRGISPVNAPWGRKGGALEVVAWVEVVVAGSLSATSAKDSVISLVSVPAAVATSAIVAAKGDISPATVLNRILESVARRAPPSSATDAAKRGTWRGTATTQSKRLKDRNS